MYLTLAQRVVRDFEAKRRLLVARADAPIEPSALRELMGAIDQSLDELLDIKQRCSVEEDSARDARRAASPLLGGRASFRTLGRHRTEASDYRQARTFIDRSIDDLRRVQAELRPNEIDLRDHVVQAESEAQASVPPPPARLTSAEAPRPPTDHERAMLDWLASTLHDVIANRPRQDWTAIGQHLLDSYGAERTGLDSSHAELQARLLGSVHALMHLDQAEAVSELTAGYSLMRELAERTSAPQV